MTTFLAIAEYSKLKFENIDVKTTAKLGKVDGKFMVTEIVLRPELVITYEGDTEKALRIMEKAEQACLITRSIKTQIVFEPTVSIGAVH